VHVVLGKYGLWCEDACVVRATLAQLCNKPIAVVCEFIVEIPCLFLYVGVQCWYVIIFVVSFVYKKLGTFRE
jgi:hypothetical protein